jgi:hypothetical protein
MSCANKHELLDLYFHEGKDDRLSELSEHAAHCAECRVYLAAIKRTMGMLSRLEDETPPEAVLTKILADVSVSQPAPAHKKTGVDVVPILQIAFGEIFVFALIYFIKIQLSFTSIWEAVEQYRIVQSIGSLGVSVILVLLAGSFITLALAPILLMESNKKFSS